MIPLLFAIVIAKCQGKFTNPFTDISWKCLFPITIGGAQIAGDKEEYEKDPSGFPICKCPPTGVPKHIGIKVTFWEPLRLIDVTRTPYCLVGLGGISLSPSTVKKHGTVYNKPDATRASFYQVHWYIYPLIYWLELLTDFICTEKKKMDLGYITEYDPLWNDDEWSFLQHPEAGWYASAPLQLACVIDCATSSMDRPTNKLFWCAGCLGSLFPFTGRVEHHIGGIQASSLLVMRILAKFHRLQVTKGYKPDDFCENHITPHIQKTIYKTHLVYPVNAPCEPLGKTDSIWASRKSFPYSGEDFVYLLWKKKKCCMGPPLSKFFTWSIGDDF